jgi:hypothetical protein
VLLWLEVLLLLLLLYAACGVHYASAHCAAKRQAGCDIRATVLAAAKLSAGLV